MATSTRLLKLFHALFYSTNAVLLSYLPLLLRERGFEPFEVGTILMLGPFLAMFAQPAAGLISDRIRKVRPLLIGLWIVLGISASLAFLTTDRILVAVSILILYICYLPSISLLDTLTVKIANSMQQSYGAVRLWGSVGFTVTAVTLAQVFDLLGGVDSLFWMYLPVWSSFFIGMFFLKEPRYDDGEPDEAVNMTILKKALTIPSLLVLLALIFVIGMPHRMNDALLSLHMSDLGATSGQVSIAWAVAGFSEVFGFIIMGRIMKRYRMLTLLSAVGMLYALRWLLYSITTEPVMLIVLQGLHSITYACFWALAIEFVVQLLPLKLAATGQSLLGMVFFGLSGLAGGVIGGALQESYGGNVMYGIGFVLALLGTFGFMLWNRKDRKRTLAVEQEATV